MRGIGVRSRDKRDSARSGMLLRTVVRSLCRATTSFALVAFLTSTQGVAMAQPISNTAMSFELYRNKIVLVVHVDGRDLTAIYDTGAERSVLSQQAADVLHLSLTGGMRVGGFGGVVTTRTAADIVVDIGGERQAFPQLPVIDLSAATASFGRRVDLVLGRDTLSDRLVEIDFAATRIAWVERAQFDPPHGISALTLVRRGAVLTVPVRLDDHPVLAGLDLGARDALTIGPDLATELGVDLSAAPTTWAHGVGGAFEQRMGNLREVEVAGVPLRDVPIAVTAGPVPGGADAILGLPVWRRFRLMLDFEAGRAWIISDPIAAATPFARDLTGLALSRPAFDRIRIERVGRGSPAEAAGLRPGDEIVAIDGVNISTWPTESDLCAWCETEGRGRRLTLANGEVRTLSLHPYY